MPSSIPAWYALVVGSRTEFRVSDDLTSRGFEPFLPVRRERHRWSDRVKSIEKPVFPGYIFCRFALKERRRVLEAAGVREIVGFGKTPARVSEEELAAVRTLVESKVLLAPWPFLRTGERIRINRGPLAGAEGVVVTAKDGNPRIVVSVSLLQRSVAAEIEREWIEPVCSGEGQRAAARRYSIALAS